MDDFFTIAQDDFFKTQDDLFTVFKTSQLNFDLDN